VWGEIRRDWWVWVPLGVILLSAVVHLIAGESANDLIGVLLVVEAGGLYLIGRKLAGRMAVALGLMSVVGSVSVIVGKSLYPESATPGLYGIYHLACFVILAGALVAPSKWRVLALVLAVPAVIMSGSEEGLVALVALLVVVVVKGGVQAVWRKWKWRAAGAALAAVGIIGILVASGWYGTAFPRLNPTRFDGDVSGMSNHRWDAYLDLLSRDVLLVGSGWEWNTVKVPNAKTGYAAEVPLYKTVHNAPLRVASQFGIAAGLAWLVIMLAALWRGRRSKYLYVFAVLLVFAMLDHFLWTSLFAAPWALVGMQRGSEERGKAAEIGEVRAWAT
jgi:hypothetical protein